MHVSPCWWGGLRRWRKFFSLWRIHDGIGSWQEPSPVWTSPHRSRISSSNCGLSGTHTLEQSVPDVPEEDDPRWSRSWITAAHGKNPWGAASEGLYSMGSIPLWSCEGLLWEGLGRSDRNAGVFLSLWGTCEFTVMVTLGLDFGFSPWINVVPAK